MLIRRERLLADERIGFLEELGSLFRHIERRVSAYFESPREWAASYHSSSGNISAALLKIKEGAAPSVALTDAAIEAKARHGVCDEVIKYISMLGGDELCAERESITRASALMAEHIAEERARLTDGARVRSAVIALIALGAVIILI